MNNSVNNGEEVSRRDAETQREEIIKTTSLIEKALHLIKSNGFLSCTIDNCGIQRANLHVNKETFLSTFSEFCYKPHASKNFRIYTTVNNVEVFSLIPPSELGIQTRTVTYTIEEEI